MHDTVRGFAFYITHLNICVYAYILLYYTCNSQRFRAREAASRAYLHTRAGLSADGRPDAAALFLALARRATRAKAKTKARKRGVINNNPSSGAGGGATAGAGSAIGVCEYCGEAGHADWDCPHLSAPERDRRRRRNKRKRGAVGVHAQDANGSGGLAFSDSESTGLMTSSSSGGDGGDNSDGYDSGFEEGLNGGRLPYSDSDSDGGYDD